MTFLTHSLVTGGLFGGLLLSQLPAHAQVQVDTASGETRRSAIPVDTARVYAASEVDQVPCLLGGGGERAIIVAIQKGFRYPALALRKGVEGTVTVSFVVKGDGHLTAISVLKGLGYGVSEEVVRVVNTLPAFIPGRIEGESVKVGFTLPVAVKIQY